ncbi:MAG: UDP-glucose 4-epimerase [Halioglobus sp.]|jgi:UDP-glucose 4-epimerase
MKCLVTGATGFIGTQLCQQLSACGVTFIALSRSGSELHDGSATQAIDLACEPVPRALLEGVDVVFHLAGIAHQSAESDAYAQLNHRATVSLAEAAATQGVKRFIYLSSVKAMGAAMHEKPRDEADCVLPLDPYGLFKLRAEQDLQKLAAGNAMSIAILRPCLVYGSTPKGNLARLARAVRAGLPRPPEVGGRSMIAVQDLAQLMIKMASGPSLCSGTWIVSDGNRYSLRTLHDSMRRALNKEPGLSWVPLWAWQIAAFAMDCARGSNTESTYEKLFGTELYSNAALLSDHDWLPKHSLADAVSDMMKPGLERQQ